MDAQQPYPGPGGPAQTPPVTPPPPYQTAQDYGQPPYQGQPMQGQPAYQGQMPYQGQPPYQGQASVYPMTDTDRTLRLVAFIFNILSMVSVCWVIIPLAWMIPMCVISWRIYKGVKPNTTAFGICTLLFLSLVGGILLLCSRKDEPIYTP